MPLRVPMKISPVPSVTWTAMTASPSSTPIAMMPPARGLLNADSAVFLTTPWRVPMTTNLSSSNSFTASIAAIFSPSSIDTRFAIDLPLPPGPDVGNLVDLQPVGAAAVREDHDVGVRRGDEQVADEVLVARPHADAALAAAPLIPVGRDRGPLDVAGVADRDRHVFLGDQILDAQLARLAFDDLGAAIVAVLRLHRRAARRR